MFAVKIILCLMFLSFVATDETDNKIFNAAQPSTQFTDEIETCAPKSGAGKIVKILTPGNSGKIDEIKFHPVILDNVSEQSNYDDIRQYARENVIYFKNKEQDYHGSLEPFLTGPIFLLIHGYMDSFDTNTRIYGIGM